MLLLRVRDEIRMVMKAYQSLYESSIAFGMRKSLMAEQKRGELGAKVRRAQSARLPPRRPPTQPSSPPTHREHRSSSPTPRWASCARASSP